MDNAIKRCGVCKEDLPLSSYTLRKGKPAWMCRQCKSAYGKRHYAGNKDYYKRNAARQKAAIRAYIRDLKTLGRCADCRKTYHYCVMDFDHRDGEAKAFNLSRAIVQGFEQVKAEIAKCDLVCANCHRLRTFRRAGSAKDGERFTTSYRKLAADEVENIRALHATGNYTHKQLANRYGVRREIITSLLNGRTYRHIEKRVSNRGSKSDPDDLPAVND